MLKNYLKIAVRSLKKDKTLSLINILGLSAGMGCALLMVLFIQDELSFDRFHRNPERVYRVVKDFVNDDGSKLPDATTPPAFAPALQRELPEVEQTVRIFPNWGRKYLLKYNDKSFYEEGVYRADSSFFTLFNFPFVQGNAATALRELKSIVLTEKAASKYFGHENPIGKTLEIDGMGGFTVSGVLADIPANSHFTFDFLIPLRTLNNDLAGTWGFYNFYTYIRLKAHADAAVLDQRVQGVFRKHQPDNTSICYTQPLTTIHLESRLKWELRPGGSIVYVYVFGTVALFLILIAAINYINLVTAKSSLRAKEIGVRKVAGAQRTTLIFQFLSESIILVMVSGLLAVGLAAALLPIFNSLTHKELSLLTPAGLAIGAAFLACSVLIGLLAGIYPALYLSGFKPVLVLKGVHQTGASTSTLRRSLIVLQFGIAVILIVGTLVINRQLDFMQTADLGFHKEHVLVLDNLGRSGSQRETLRQALLQVPGISKAAGADGMVTGQNSTNSMQVKGASNTQLVNFLSVGYDYLDVMGITLKEGRNFSPHFPSDSIDAIILNEQAVKDLGVPEPVIGQLLVWDTTPDTTIYVKVVGVVKDFHFTSLREQIKPFAFTYTPQQENQLAVRIGTANLPATLQQVQETWQKLYPDQPLDFYFLDEHVDKLYRAERDFRNLFSYFTLISLLIACLGLFGLAAFTAEQRTKEIGIRKVLGASVSGIVALLSRDFLKLVLIAALIAMPLAAYLMRQWLDDFAYRTPLPWWSFAAALAVVVTITLATVSFQAIRAALANPVNSLRSE